MTRTQTLVVLQRREQCETRVGTVHHRRRDRVIERDDRIVGHALEHLVQREDLRPVGILGARRLVVDGGDRRLQLILANATLRQRRAGERHAFGDGSPIPQRSILLVERNQLAIGSRARRTTRVGQQHQRQQAGNVSVVGQQLVHLARRAESLRSTDRCDAGPRPSSSCSLR